MSYAYSKKESILNIERVSPTENEEKHLLFKVFSFNRMESRMPRNLNDNDTRSFWIPPQNQLYTSRFVTSQDGRSQVAQPQHLAQTERPTGQKPKPPAKMPKERAMALANKFKRGLAIASLVSFGTFGGLVALHQVGTTSTQSTQSSSGSSSSNSTSSSSQKGGNTSGSSSSSSGSSSSSTVSGTHTS